MYYVFLVYLVSIVSWGLVSYKLGRAVLSTSKADRSTLLVPLLIASVALFIESLYFGVASYFFTLSDKAIFFYLLAEDKWFLIKVLIAVSGVILVANLNINKK